MSNQTSIQAILVCQGAEYKAVRRGLSRVTSCTPSVIPMPVGTKPNSIYLPNSQDIKKILNHPQPRVLVMGLCGSLKPNYQVGDVVLYKDCLYQKNTGVQKCDTTFTASIQEYLQDKISVVKALTSDRIIWLKSEKRLLGQTLDTDVVDMEGFAILEFFKSTEVAVAMLRVVSDGCDGNIPNLNSALSHDGSFQPLLFGITMLKQPIAATRLIRGSLKGLQILEQVTTFLFQ
ncbi:MAG: nucleoside phosphorylase [Fischerella sp.]|nr:nucleoside phosphorylase [Fischerella sp.]